MIMIMNNIPDDDDAIFSNASFVPDLGPDALYIHVSIGISQIVVFNILSSYYIDINTNTISSITQFTITISISISNKITITITITITIIITYNLKFDYYRNYNNN